jgi:2-amino-4-hydroxy-6-hydroxymethyldihydropteridine diphosphokinase
VTRAVLSIGSNLGDRLRYLRGCVAQLDRVVHAVSAVYATQPWGGVSQDEFLNAVLLVEDPDADAQDWLRRSQHCETVAQRTRTLRWGPRTLDVDVIDVDHTRRDDPQLTLPHPRAHERAFVLVPWLEVAPDAVLVGHGPVADLVAALPAEQRRGVQRRDELTLWDSRLGSP